MCLKIDSLKLFIKLLPARRIYLIKRGNNAIIVLIFSIFDIIYPNMENISTKKIILEAFRQMLGAIIRLALRNSVNYTEFANLTKALYVEIAAKEFGIKGRETNVSRISMMTGLDRKEVKRIKDMADDQAIITTSTPDKMTAILNEWHQNSMYTDVKNEPKVLDFSDQENSFSELVHKFGGGIAPITVLRELIRSGVVEKVESGKVKVLKKHYIPNYYVNSEKKPDYVNPNAITHGSSMLVDHINTIFHNLYREDNSLSQLDLRATQHAVKKSKVKEFYQYIDNVGMDFLTKVDQWLKNNSVADIPKDDKSYIRLGVGLYSIEGENKTIGLLNSQ